MLIFSHLAISYSAEFPLNTIEDQAFNCSFISMVGSEMDILSNFEKYSLLEGATPIQRLWRLEQALGCDVHIYVKRDDLMGVGGGGNKLRKREFLIGEAKSKGCDTIITTGGL